MGKLLTLIGAAFFPFGVWGGREMAVDDAFLFSSFRSLHSVSSYDGPYMNVTSPPSQARSCECSHVTTVPARRGAPPDGHVTLARHWFGSDGS